MSALTFKELQDIALPKWPGCDVDGAPVSVEQAMEILVRTSGALFLTNDRDFEKMVSDIYYSAIPHSDWPLNWWHHLSPYIYGIQRSDEPLVSAYTYSETYNSKMGLLRLDYLTNHRVCSSYIGGPHGWCDWNGNIFYRGHNIGKWPTATEVLDEWGTIAHAFPFLKLTCRLLCHEAGYHEDNGFDRPTVAVVYEVENGKVFARRPNESDKELASPHTDCESFFDAFQGFNISRERGCTPHQWKAACEHTAQRMRSLALV